jgi:ABC-2 type transport system permease protein
VYLLLGIVLWGFFVEATNQGMQAIVSRGDLIRKINFPKYIIIISGTISALINLCLNLVVVFVFMLINGVDLRPEMFLFVFNILELYVLALAIAFFLGAAYVKYRDISYIWEVLLQGAFYAVPIIYPISMVITQSQVAAQILLLNPVAQIIQDARFNLVTDQTVTTSSLIHNPLLVAVPYVIVGLLIIIAALYFKKNSKYFAERI